jgi:type IV secretion system protein VirD4
MAEQRPYRVRGFSANRRLLQAKLLVLLALAAAFVAINWVTTQHAAKLLRHAPWLGPPLLHLSDKVIYAPWSWMVWWVRWYWAPELAPLWQQCTHEALYPMATLTAIGCAAIAIVRQGWFADVSDLHGSAHWGTLRNLRAARLIDRRRNLLRLIAVRLRLLRPLKRRAGIYLGLWQGWFRSLYIRDCSPTHVLVFAPSRSGKGAGVVLPTLLTWPHSVLVYDIKGENWGLTAGARKRAGQVCLKFAPTTDECDNARFNPLAEIRLRTPNEDRDTRNLVEMIIDPHGQGLPDHWSREGSAFFSGIILHQLYSCQDKTLNGVEATLCDPQQPVDDTLQQIMRAVHDPLGAEGWNRFTRQPDTDPSSHCAGHAQHARQGCQRALWRDLAGEGIPRALP